MNESRLMIVLAAVWEPLRRIVKNEEPALAAGAVGVVVELLGHFNLHLSQANQTYLSIMILGFISWLVRQQVTPVTKLPDAMSTITHLWYTIQGQMIDKAKQPQQVVHIHNKEDPPLKRKTKTRKTTS